MPNQYCTYFVIPDFHVIHLLRQPINTYSMATGLSQTRSRCYAHWSHWFKFFLIKLYFHLDKPIIYLSKSKATNKFSHRTVLWITSNDASLSMHHPQAMHHVKQKETEWGLEPIKLANHTRITQTNELNITQISIVPQPKVSVPALKPIFFFKQKKKGFDLRQISNSNPFKHKRKGSLWLKHEPFNTNRKIQQHS